MNDFFMDTNYLSKCLIVVNMKWLTITQFQCLNYLHACFCWNLFYFNLCLSVILDSYSEMLIYNHILSYYKLCIYFNLCLSVILDSYSEMLIYNHILSYYKLCIYSNLCLSVMLASLSSILFTSISFLTNLNHIGSVMDSVFASNAVDRVFEQWSSQTRDQ
jgi:hypothetical protein